MLIDKRPTSSLIIGFDSAWTDKSSAPGAICAIVFDEKGVASFREPILVSFAQALEFISAAREGSELALLALDQPTIVPNGSGSRPVEKVAASVISYIGGGVQPSHTGKLGMFCPKSPIWDFKRRLGAIEAPEECRTARCGLFLVEVFPALALAGLHDPFGRRLGAPKYNPANRRRFRLSDWREVGMVVANLAAELEIPELSDWALGMSDLQTPRKSDQDRMDAAICALVGLIWRAGDRGRSALLGDLSTGYMVTPVSADTHARLAAAAVAKAVAFA